MHSLVDYHHLPIPFPVLMALPPPTLSAFSLFYYIRTSMNTDPNPGQCLIDVMVIYTSTQ